MVICHGSPRKLTRCWNMSFSDVIYPYSHIWTQKWNRVVWPGPSEYSAVCGLPRLHIRISLAISYKSPCPSRPPTQLNQKFWMWGQHIRVFWCSLGNSKGQLRSQESLTYVVLKWHGCLTKPRATGTVKSWFDFRLCYLLAVSLGMSCNVPAIYFFKLKTER